MSVDLSHSGYADHHVEKMKHTTNSKNCIPIVGEDLNAELGPGDGIVGKHTFNGGNKRGIWMKHWLMIQNFTALNTMYRKTPGKQTTYRSRKGNEKQIDYNIIKRRHLYTTKTPKPTTHMGSDHRCVMAAFVITTPKKDGTRKTKKRTTKQDIRKQTQKI